MTQEQKDEFEKIIDMVANESRTPIGGFAWRTNDLEKAMKAAYNLACDKCANPKHSPLHMDVLVVGGIERIEVVDKSSILKNKIQ